MSAAIMNTSQDPSLTASWPQIQLLSMPQLAEAIGREDDWTGTNDAAARRKAQTRLNTRAYRKRKALEKNIKINVSKSGSKIKSETFVECWDNERQSVVPVPASRAKQIYNTKQPLIPERGKQSQPNVIFPLCPDHLITLLQFNALRAMAVNRSLVSGILITPLDCGGEAELIHTIPYPSNPSLLPATLLPTIIQQTIPHGEWIDMFPSPEGRDALILATGTFDEDDLWADCIGGLFEGFPGDEMEKRGIIAWSPPWDITGWEMSEGFLRKWGWLFRGFPEALEATNRWRLERGEEPLVDDNWEAVQVIE